MVNSTPDHATDADTASKYRPLRRARRGSDVRTKSSDLNHFRYRTITNFRNCVPAGFGEGDADLYRYVNNNPANAVDPTGMVLVAFDGTDNKHLPNNPDADTNVWQFYTHYHGPLDAPTDSETYLSYREDEIWMDSTYCGVTRMRIENGSKLYIPGVGSWNGDGPAFGGGTKERSAYAHRWLDEYLDKHGQIDAAIDIVGFSRGAASARQFANDIKDLLAKYSKYNARIRFIGVFDTVPSQGLNHDRGGLTLTLPQYASGVAFHAMAANEDRSDFQLERYDGATELWFDGVHSDVGGGYARNESGLSNMALRWMFQNAFAQGVPVHWSNQKFPSTLSNTVYHDQIRASAFMAATQDRMPRISRRGDKADAMGHVPPVTRPEIPDFYFYF